MCQAADALFKIHRVSSKQVRKTSSGQKRIVYISGTEMPETVADQKSLLGGLHAATESDGA
jgi:hypothetical protein